MAKYRLLALDIDGTLTNNKKEITAHTAKTLERAQRNGLKIVLASGRPTQGIVPVAEQLRLAAFSGYIMAFNGSLITDCRTGTVLYANTLPPEILPVLYDCARQGGFAILSYKGKYVVTENPEDEYVQKELFLNKMEALHVPDFLAEITYPVEKCLIVGDPEPLAKLEKEMQAKLGSLIGVYRSEPFFLELVPKGVDKARAMEHLLKPLDITPDEIIAIGDGFNDISMIKFAGLGVAMENAQKEVRECADFITLTNEQDGVAAVIDRFVCPPHDQKNKKVSS